MGTMYRLKAYFGMVPAEEMGEYVDERWDDRFSYDDDPQQDRYDDGWDRRPPRPLAGDRPGSRGASGVGPPEVRGALALDPDAQRDHALHEPSRPVTAVPDQRDRAGGGAAALARITTLQPRSYNEARTIGERYRDGIPVIMNLTELDDAAAKRLVDFAAGLAFALRGSIDKVANRVFLLTPADVEVSVDDARRLAERGLFRQY
ncbi:MAG: cell division protein SepF [Pseudonocardia sp.]